jgi:hypothetical protein
MKNVSAGTVLALALSACSNSAPVTGLPFDPIDFFAGHTQGEARLELIVGSPRRVAVDSQGVRDAHGGLVLVQRIAEQGRAPRVRTWVLKPAGRGHWLGTLSDADGAVRVERTPSDVVIRYRMHGGANVEQHLQKPPGGVVENRMTVTRFGVRLASLDEHIRKVRA